MAGTGSQFKPVGLEKVEQGQFKFDSDAAFLRIQQAVIRHHEKHEIPVSGKLTLSVEIKAEDGGYKILTNIAEKLPQRPPDPRRVTTAFASEDEGQRCLFAADSGTTTGNPRQKKLFNDNGTQIKKPEPVAVD